MVHGGVADDVNAEAWYREFLHALRLRGQVSPLPALHGYYFDKAGWHWYASAEKLRKGPEVVRALLAEAGIPKKPIWVTEMGIPVWSEYPGPCWDAGSPRRGTLDEQASYVWQAMAEGLAAGVETQVYFQLYDDCGNGEASYDALGLVRNPAPLQCWTSPGDHACWSPDPALAGRPRGAFEAFHVLSREMAGVIPVGATDDPGLRRLTFFRAPDTRITVAWATTARAATLALPAAAGAAVRYALDERGDVVATTVTATGGRLLASLPGTTNHNGEGGATLVGGRPVIFVERDQSGPVAQVHPLPESSPQRFDVALSIADAGTGIAAYQVFFSIVRPQSLQDWLDLRPATAWQGPPTGGTVTIPFAGQINGTYYFTAITRDRAGNWSGLQLEPQAWTRVAGPTTAPAAAAPSAVPAPATTADTSFRSAWIGKGLAFR